MEVISMTYEELLCVADKEGLIVKEKALESGDGRIYNNRVAIRKDLPTTAEKTCVLAEELGHYYTTSGDILNQTSIQNRKQELQARVWAYSHMITMDMLLECKRRGCRSRYEVAEYLGVTEEFLQDALDQYRSIYGIAHQSEKYLVTFEPFNIYDMDD